MSYTFSKWIDNVQFTGGDGAAFGDHERSLSTNHVPHRLVIPPIIELPFGNGRRGLNHRAVLNALAGGWQVSTLGTFQAGSPFGILVLNGPRDILGDQADGKNLRPDIVANSSIGDRRGNPAPGQRGILWFDPVAFRTPARFTHGNVSRTCRGSGTGPDEFRFAGARSSAGKRSTR